MQQQRKIMRSSNNLMTMCSCKQRLLSHSLAVLLSVDVVLHSPYLLIYANVNVFNTRYVSSKTCFLIYDSFKHPLLINMLKHAQFTTVECRVRSLVNNYIIILRIRKSVLCCILFSFTISICLNISYCFYDMSVVWDTNIINNIFRNISRDTCVELFCFSSIYQYMRAEDVMPTYYKYILKKIKAFLWLYD